MKPSTSAPFSASDALAAGLKASRRRTKVVDVEVPLHGMFGFSVDVVEIKTQTT